MTPEIFIDTYSKYVIESVKGTGLFPSVKIAQMALETGWGKSIKTAANNCFGIKAGKSWSGTVISNSTWEYINGKNVRFVGTNQVYSSYNDAITSGAPYQTLFRVYNSIIDSIKDHTKLLLKPRFAPVLMAKSPELQAMQLKICGYATAANYDKVLIQIINKYDLRKFDK